MNSEFFNDISMFIKNSFNETNNIFSSIKLDNTFKTNSNDKKTLSPIFQKRILNFAKLFDDKNDKANDEANIKTSLSKDIELLEGLSDMAYNNTLLSIYEKYTSFCPFDDGDFQDVNCFQKKKFDMAIEKVGDGSLAYVMFEVTGIYDYLFNFRKNEKGTLKMMRARSFNCLLISRAVILNLLNKFGFPKCNILDDGGELFGYLINRDTIPSLENAIIDMKKDLIKRFDGAVNLLYAIKEKVTKDELFNNSTQLLQYFSEALYENEFHLFDHITDELEESKFRVSNANTCQYCGRDYKDLEGDRCELCNKEFEIGDHIAKARYLVSFIGKSDKADIGFFGRVSYKFCKDETEVKKFIATISDAEYIDIAAINSTEFIKGIEPRANISYSFTTIGNSAPMNGTAIMSFDDLEEKATGSKYLSAVALDADNFGTITNNGGFGDKTSLLRVATLSQYFKYFFQGYLSEVIEKYMGYTIFCGGDDLFLIAPWDKAIEIARQIDSDFKRFTGNNEFLSVSTGVQVLTRTTSIKNMRDMANSKLNDAKKGNKNGCAIFGDVSNWTEIDELISYIESTILEGKEYREPFGNSLIYDLHRLSRLKTNDLIAIPKIFHRLREKPQLIKEDEKLYKYLIKEPKMFNFIANYCSLYTRGGMKA